METIIKNDELANKTHSNISNLSLHNNDYSEGNIVKTNRLEKL